MTPAVVTRDLSCRFGAVHAVRDTTIQIEKGEFVAVEGPSGSGKSTLLNLIGGIEPPTAGSVQVNGVELADMNEKDRATVRRQQIGMIFQLYDLLPTLNAWQNVAVPALLEGNRLGAMKNRSAELLKRVGLADRADHRPSALSGGEQQRVAIARALMNNPALILADEPTGALDSVAGDDILTIMRSLCDDGHTVIMVTHAARAAAYADRSLQMIDGQVSVGQAQLDQSVGLD